MLKAKLFSMFGLEDFPAEDLDWQVSIFGLTLANFGFLRLFLQLLELHDFIQTNDGLVDLVNYNATNSEWLWAHERSLISLFHFYVENIAEFISAYPKGLMFNSAYMVYKVKIFQFEKGLSPVIQ